MTKLDEFHQLPRSEVELPYTELFGAPSPVYNESLAGDCGDVDEGPNVLGSSSSEMVNNDDWEWLQKYEDISCVLENCPRIYERCININDICCKNDRQSVVVGPTLAELNERRALSPLVNPDMKRLHLVATKHDEEKIEQFAENSSGRQNRSCLSEINRPIPRKWPWPTQDTIVGLPQNKSENLPASLRRMLLYGINRPGALNSFVKTEKIQNKEPDRGVQEIQVQSPPSNSTDEKQQQKSEDISPDNVQSDSDSERTSDISDREVSFIEDDDMSSASEDDDDDDDVDGDDDDDEMTPTKSLADSRKRKRSEAEDMTPDPKKLFEIGRQLERLNRIINGLRPNSQTNANAKDKTRREKNKLASRACRLKKKAGHEANKIKLFGLNQENKHLTDLLYETKELLIKNQKEKVQKQSWHDVEVKVENVFENPVAGNIPEYVDSMLIDFKAKNGKHHSSK